MVFRKTKVDQSLKKKGFVVESGDHKYYRYYTLSDKKTNIRTKMSHGNRKKDVDKNLESSMASQCKLSRNDFKKLIECSISQAEYEKLVEEKFGYTR